MFSRDSRIRPTLFGRETPRAEKTYHLGFLRLTPGLKMASSGKGEWFALLELVSIFTRLCK